MGRRLDLTLGVLNGAIGDYLARTENGLATEMHLVHEGETLELDREAITRAHGTVTPKVALLVHGVMCTEDVFTMQGGSDYGSLLADDLGFTPFYIRYNSGLAIPDNGAALARILAKLTNAYPVPIDEILPVGFSMGGLVIRSACHVAKEEGLDWLARVRRAIYVGTPHLGAPLERAGRVVARLLQAFPDPYTRLIADVANLRSDGVKDLGDADLRHKDRARRVPRVALRDPRHPVPLLAEIQHYLVAGSLSADPTLATFFGDALVPVPSATDGACTDSDTLALPPGHVRILHATGHLALAHHPDVYAQIRAWCEESPA